MFLRIQETGCVESATSRRKRKISLHHAVGSRLKEKDCTLGALYKNHASMKTRWSIMYIFSHLVLSSLLHFFLCIFITLSANIGFECLFFLVLCLCHRQGIV